MKMRAWVAAIAVVAVVIQPTWGISVRHDVPESEYFDLASQFPAAGRLDVSGIGAWCSASLVAPDKVLSAAHCFDGVFGSLNNQPDINPNQVSFRLGDNVGSPTATRGISSIEINTWNGQARWDMAVLTLSAPISDVEPLAIHDANPAGMVTTMIGFGNNGNGLNFPRPFDNRKRAAQNILDMVGTTIQSDFDRASGTTSSFGSSAPLDLEGTTAGGDSGGPITVNFDGTEAIVGVLHGGFNSFGPDSRYGDISIWAPIRQARNMTFLANQGLTVGLPDPSNGDFNNDGAYDCSDIDALTLAVTSGSSDMSFDLTGDGNLDINDVTAWRSEAGENNIGPGISYQLGDANLDGNVDIGDFNLWNANKFTFNGAWCSGDFNVDGGVDVQDFNLWNTNIFTSAGDLSAPALEFASVRPFHSLQSVPEPGSWTLTLLAMGVAISLFRRKR